MPRSARFIEVNTPYHVTQHANGQQVAFYDDQDRRLYLFYLQEYARRWKLDILAYCLMSNHIHLAVIPRENHSMARCIGTLHMVYAQYLNKKLGMKGHLWQSRYYSGAMSERHLYAAMRYVERNPVRAGIVSRPGDYSWSSAQAHLGLEAKEPQISLMNLNGFLEVGSWEVFLEESDNKSFLDQIRYATKNGKRLD